jgi:MscS family membrane protein
VETLLKMEWFQDFLRHPTFWVSLGTVCFIWLITGLALVWRIILLEKLIQWVGKPDARLYTAILVNLRNPTAFLLVFLGVLASLMAFPVPSMITPLLPAFRIIGFVVIVGWILINLTAVVEMYCLKVKEIKAWDQHTVGALIRVVRVLILAAMLVVGLQSLGVPLSGLLAFGGAGTLIVGFASKDLLANCVGAMAIYLDRPFNVGDWIASPDKNIEGTVEHIGWRLTRIRRFNKQPLYVPNSLFSTVIIENPSRMTNRQIKEIIALRYSDASKLPNLIETLQSFLDEHPDLDHHCTTFIAFNHLTAYSLNCSLYCFTNTTEWVPYLRVQEAILLGILDIVHQHGCEVAIPIHDLKIANTGLGNLETE